jgi:hypothetical protein
MIELQRETRRQAIDTREIEYYRRLIRLVIALCSLVYEWRNGEKPPSIRELM